MRYFRAVSAAVYEAVRADLDVAYGYPAQDGKTATAITPALEAPIDSEGRVYLLATQAECQYPAVADRLPGLLSGGMVEEVMEADWDVLFPPPAARAPSPVS
jgi:hypothetical protein